MLTIIKCQIPNCITLCNLIFGILSIHCCINNKIETASYFILLSMLMDFFDGLLARYLNITSLIGKELDSLADMVSFGIAPTYIVMALCTEHWSKYFAIFLAIGTCIRLARFNVNIQQREHFIGLPSPMSALFVVGLPFTNVHSNIGLLAIVFSLALIMNVNFPMFALKKNINNPNSYFLLALILISLLSIVFFKAHLLAITSCITLSYVLVNIFKNRWNVTK